MGIDAYSSNINSPFYSTGLNSASESLASGSRINRTSDDAAGQAIITALTSQINSQDMASRNANTGISLLQTADGASDTIGQSLQRMNELSLQAMNGTMNDSQRSMLNDEFQQNLEMINQVSQSTTFNGMNLLNGDNANISIALGEGSSDLTLANLTTDGLNLSGLDITSAASASSALSGLTTAIEQLGSARSQFGAQQNGLSSAVNNLQSQNISNQANRSQMSDTDFAKAITEQVRQGVLNQTSVAMQAQGNQSKADVLQLLS
ncbi:MAG: flagellin-like protein [Gammaproteobacteria bacterium]|nr:flagellin-like protein [Gammaproteobacteria bacterium]